MEYIVSTNVTGTVHWLKGTIWTSHKPSATIYFSRSNAEEAIKKASKFNPKPCKVAKIETQK